MKKFFLKNGRGFTLMETLIYIGIFTLVTLIISSFLFWLVRSGTKNKVMRETLDSARRAMETMTNEIRVAKSIYTPTTSSNQLSLETKKYLANDEKTSYIDFYLCQSRLCFKKESQNPIALTSESVEVTNLVFSRVISGESSSLKIDLRINYKNPANRPEYQSSVNLTSTVSLRNY